MKWFGSIALLVVFTRHNAIFWLAALTGYSPAATYRMLGGILESTLCAMLLVIALEMNRSIWRDLLVGAMTIGIIEGLQVTGCRAIISDITKVPKDMNVCDYATGLPLSTTMMVLYLLMICWVAGHAIRSR